MPVNTTHADYLGAEYEKMRDVFGGQRTVKAKSTSYLPKTGGMIEQESQNPVLGTAAYDAYIRRALFTGLVAPAVFGLTGLAHRVPWEIELPTRLEYMREKATKSGITLDALIESVTPEILLTGHHGLLADATKSGEPRIVTYQAETIINWREEERMPIMIVLKETEREPLVNDRFATKDVDVYRVLELAEGSYRVEEHRKYNDGTSYVADELETPSLQKGYIPFFIAGSQSTGVSPDKIPLADMAEHLIRAYQLSADLGQILHMCSSPTYHAYGVQKGEEPQVFGPDVVVTYSMEKSRAEYVEVSGNGIDKIIIEMDRQITLAKASSHELAEQGSRIESGEALATRVANKTATLRSVIINSANAVEQVLKSCAEMIGANPDQVMVTPNLAFTQEQADATLVTAFNNAVGANNLPRNILWKYLRDANVISDMEDEDIEDALEKQAEEADQRLLSMQQAAFDMEGGDDDDEEEDDDKQAA